MYKSSIVFRHAAILATLMLCAACRNNADVHIPFTKPIFHVKAKYWYKCQWQVVFTNNNFLTEEQFMNCWDGSGKYTGNNIVHQLIIFKTEQDAIVFAKKFTNYQMCRKWNDSVLNVATALNEFRKQHPIQKIEDDDEAESCKNEEGKEVVVY